MRLTKEDKQQIESLADQIKDLDKEGTFRMAEEFSVLNSPSALQAQDEETAQAVADVHDAVYAALLQPGGQIDRTKLKELCRHGIQASPAGDPQDPTQAAILIRIADGDLQFEVEPD